jgi:hypothetical protein
VAALGSVLTMLSSMKASDGLADPSCVHACLLVSILGLNSLAVVLGRPRNPAVIPAPQAQA